ncbi:MAG: GGDEF domain-containing protein [Magnetococcales bacterium]|nr:GGDEF domain-containing protein [Magnetococcales bacterium]
MIISRMLSRERELGRKYKDGEVIFHQGESADSLYVIQKGRVEIVLLSEQEETRLAVYGEGETFGETSLFANKARYASARALGGARVLRIDQKTFVASIHRDSSLSYRVIKRMAERMYELEHELIRNVSVNRATCAVTGLPRFDDPRQLLEREVGRCRMMMQSLAYALIDLDDAKGMRARLGDEAYGGVLRALSGLLKQRLRRTDFMGRYGGDSFPVILYEADGSAALRTLDGVRREFERLRHGPEGAAFSATFSCGVAVFPIHASAEGLLAAAGKALEEAKAGGRNRVILAPGPDGETVVPLWDWMRYKGLDLLRRGK